MNWREWYDTGPRLTEGEARISVLSWDKCKEEVLKILQAKNNYFPMSGTIDGKVIEEIEKL